MPLQKQCLPNIYLLIPPPPPQTFIHVTINQNLYLPGKDAGLRHLQFLWFLILSLLSSSTNADLRKRFYTITNSIGISSLGSFRYPFLIKSGPRCLLPFIFVNVFHNKFYSPFNVTSSDDLLLGTGKGLFRVSSTVMQGTCLSTSYVPFSSTDAIEFLASVFLLINFKDLLLLLISSHYLLFKLPF